MDSFAKGWQFLVNGMGGFTYLVWAGLALSPVLWVVYVQVRWWWFWRKKGGRPKAYTGNGEIEARLGKMGAGKSFTLTYTVWKARLVRPDMPVYTNMPITLPGSGPVYALRNLKDFLKARNGLVVIDELNTVLPSRVWKAAPGALLFMFSHARKHGLDIVFTAQHEKRVDTIVRELVTRWVYVSNWQRLGFFIGRMMQDFGMGKPSTMGVSFVPAPFLVPEIAEAYDTKFRLKPQEWVTGKDDLGDLEKHELKTWDDLRREGADVEGQDHLQKAG